MASLLPIPFPGQYFGSIFVLVGPKSDSTLTDLLPTLMIIRSILRIILIVESQNSESIAVYRFQFSIWAEVEREMIECGGTDLDPVSSWKQMMEWNFQELGLRISL